MLARFLAWMAALMAFACAAASVCETRRCHAHIWCGGENSWVRALKMGPYPTELALVLQEGDLDAYSVRRIWDEMSNDRGDFVLHPSPFHLNGGGTSRICSSTTWMSSFTSAFAPASSATTQAWMAGPVRNGENRSLVGWGRICYNTFARESQGGYG